MFVAKVIENLKDGDKKSEYSYKWYYSLHSDFWEGHQKLVLCLACLNVPLQRKEQTGQNRARFHRLAQIAVHDDREIVRKSSEYDRRAEYRVDAYAGGHELELVDETFNAVEGRVEQDVFEHFGIEELLFCVSFFENDEDDKQVEDESDGRDDRKRDDWANKFEPFESVDKVILAKIEAWRLWQAEWWNIEAGQYFFLNIAFFKRHFEPIHHILVDISIKCKKFILIQKPV